MVFSSVSGALQERWSQSDQLLTRGRTNHVIDDPYGIAYRTGLEALSTERIYEIRDDRSVFGRHGEPVDPFDLLDAFWDGV